MPSYRGIDHADLFASVRAGLSFLKEKNIGPATAKRMAEWTARNPDFLQREPYSNAVFVVNMRSARTHLLFSGLEPVFAASAAIEAKDDLPGPATKIYRDLMAWGAFQAYEADSATEAVEAEAQRHVMSLCLDRLKKEDCAPRAPAWDLITGNAPLARSDDRIPEVLHLARDLKMFKIATLVDPAIIQFARQMVPLFVDLHEMDCQEPIDQLIVENPPAAYQAGSMLYHMTGLKQAEKNLQIQAPLQLYTILTPFEGDQKNAHAEFTKILAGMESMLLTYHMLDEAIREPMPIIFRQQKQCGLIFGGTKNFGQIVANNLMEYKVVGPTGEIVLPRRGPEPDQPLLYGPQ